MSWEEIAKGSRPGAIVWLVRFVLLLVMAGVVYYPGLHGDFQYDDIGLVRDNEYIRVDALTPGRLWKAAFQDFRNNRPLANLSFALNYYGGRLNPFGYHLTNLFLLMASCLGIYLLVWKLLARLGYEPGKSEVAAWMVAAIWVLHPLNTQAISYIIQRYTSLSGMFCIYSLLFFHLGAEKKRGGVFYLVAFLSWLMGLASKETALCLPALVFAYKLFFFDRLEPGWVRRNWKWLAGLSAGYALLMFFLLRPSIFRMVFDFSRFPFSAYQRLLTEPKVLLWYPLLVLFPFPQFQSLVHEFAVSSSLFAPRTTLLYIAAFMALIIFALYSSRRHKIFSFMVVWFYGNLAVEALPLGIDLAHEHRLYLSSLGLIGPLVAWPILRMEKSRLAVLLLGVVAAFLGWFSWQRNTVWKTAESLWRDASAKAPESSLAWYNYCSGLPLKSSNCRQVVAVCSRALQFFPDSGRLENHIGYCLFQLGQLDKAERHLFAAAVLAEKGGLVGLGGSSGEERDELAAAYFNLGSLYMKKGNYEAAARFYLASLKIDSADPKAHYGLARAWLALGREEQYLEQLQAALKAAPGWAKVRLELAAAFAARNRCRESLELLQAGEYEGDDYEQIKLKCSVKTRERAE